MKRAASLLVVAALLQPVMVHRVLAEECPLERASYIERDQGYVLRFFATTNRDMASTSHRFYVVRPNDDRNLVGTISGNMGVSRDTGVAQRDCPTDDPGVAPADVTEAQWDDCTYWKGLVYQLVDGGAEMLPFASEPAPPALLLTDFGRQIRYSGLLDGPSDTPWDVFTLIGCRW
jgi:hypothetical protein